MKQPIKDWWYFLQPNGLLGCYDVLLGEIAAIHLSRDEAISNSESLSDSYFEYDEVELDHEAAVQAALDELPLPNPDDACPGLLRYQVAKNKDGGRSGLGDDLVRKSKLTAPLSHKEPTIGVRRPQRDARMNERFREGFHLESVDDAIRVLCALSQGELDDQVDPVNWVWNFGPVCMQIDRDSNGRIKAIALGPKVGDVLVSHGWAVFETLITEVGYRIKYYSITESGKLAAFRLSSGHPLFVQ